MRAPNLVVLTARGSRAIALGLAVVLTFSCGGSAPRPNVKETVIVPPPDETPSVTTSREEVEPFRATSGPGDAPAPYVRDERSSRLDVPLPRGVVRQEWIAALATKPAFVLTAGNRVAVVGPDAWAVYDTRGNRIDSGKAELGTVRLDRASGAVAADDSRSPDTPQDAKVATRNGLAVMVKEGAVYVGERAIEGRFEAYDVAIDDDLACVIVRQDRELSLWTVPITSSGGIGRHRVPGAGRRPVGPPVLGKTLRVLSLDNGLFALGLDGKRLWERRGVPTGGISITEDDHVLVADGAKVLAIDRRGRATELWSGGEGVVLVTPPVLDARGALFVASDKSLYALSFS